jgi:AcrR family transcriptional regulator
MARIVKEGEYTARRNEILDSARRLVYSKGFDLMTIQDILDDLGISKGAFYHYFQSKGAVMEAFIERMVVEEVLPMLAPIVEDPGLSALEKLNRYIDSAVRWKTTKKSLMLSLMRVWFADENALVRQKMFDMTLKKATPLLSVIIRQGVQEGVFSTTYPEQVCRVMVYILQGLSDTFIEMLLLNETDRDAAEIEKGIATYVEALGDAVERVLGAPRGSLKLVDVETLMEWFVEEDTVDRRLEPVDGRQGTSEQLVLQ